MEKFLANIKYIFFPIVFIYLEVVFKIFSGGSVSGDIIYPIFTAITAGGIVALLASLFEKKIGRIIGYTILGVVGLLFCVQLVYINVFKTAFTFAMIGGDTGGANALTEFADLTFGGILENIFAIILFFLPIPLTVLLDVKIGIYKKESLASKLIALLATVTIHIIALVAVAFSGDNGYTAKVIYFDHLVRDISIDKLGVLTTMKLDLKECIFGVEEKLDDIEGVQSVPTLPNVISPSENESTSGDEDREPESTTEEPTTEPPVVYEPNVLDIDFDAFTSGENNKNITWLNNFFKASEPTMKNEYTGMFEGYNLILITAESFSPWAVSEKYTPTLYKLVNEGFVFENFYTPAYNNTTQGEWTVCTGLMPNGMGSTAFASTINNGNKYMGMCFGNILGDMGYKTMAYHNHTHSYYNRHLTHPNMGYTYKGKGDGLAVDPLWPASDLQMMELSVDDYINEEQFHAYYMTVSGHMNYTWTGNSMASRNRSLVADMDAPETMKGYMACNIELDKALAYLIGRLEEKGVADKTVIAMACDHYPYALESELTQIIGADNKEFYGLYESNLVIWSASMEEPVHVDKVCSTIDIVPTLLNLMGIEYDSRLYSGKDILSDSPGLVIFSDMGFATDYCVYNSKTGNIRATASVEITDEYISSVSSLAKNIWNAAGRIINTDYYAKLSKYKK